MQDHDWNDLKYVLALERTGTLAQAGRQLGVSETTVGRRLKRLEQSVGASLFLRNEQGRYDLTDAGQAVMAHAEAVERENAGLREQLGQRSDMLTGHVRISSVPVIVNRVLIPNLGSLLKCHPRLTVELVPDPRNVDLTRREADLAVRFSRPRQGGHAVRARKLATLSFEVFRPAVDPRDGGLPLDWISYDDASVSLPQVRWLETLRSRHGGGLSPLRVADLDSAVEAVAGGLGRTLLPGMIANADRRLLKDTECPEMREMSREIWLLSHADQEARMSIGAAKTWLAGLPWK